MLFYDQQDRVEYTPPQNYTLSTTRMFIKTINKELDPQMN